MQLQFLHDNCNPNSLSTSQLQLREPGEQLTRSAECLAAPVAVLIMIAAEQKGTTCR
jgi:hypothetical protein